MSTHGTDEFQGTDRFVIERRLGTGGMGVVYQAYDRQRSERVALKTLRNIDPAEIYRLKQEFRQLVDFTHPNLVALYELISAGEQWFFTMQLVDGVNFLEFVRPISPTPDFDAIAGVARRGEPVQLETMDHRSLVTAIGDETELFVEQTLENLSPQLDIDRLRVALRQLAEGVHALHGTGKLHRDIKPSNVLVDQHGRVVLLDFGLVTELDDQRRRRRGPVRVAGTPAYMAPEQAAGHQLTPATDWYSVGVLLFISLTGKLPFGGKREEVLDAKQRIEPPPPCDIADGIPADLSALCVDLLRRSPDQRPDGRAILHRVGSSLASSTNFATLRSPSLRDTPFVGRDRHLADLMDAFLATRQGRTVVDYVHGRSGMGKSVLVQRFLTELANDSEVVVLAGRCYEQESVPFKALDSLVDALSRYLIRLSRLEAEALMPRDVLALARVFPVLRRVEAVADAPRRPFETPDQQELRRRAFAALRELLVRLGDRRALVLFIDDLQWGDVDSAALISDLLRPPDPPLLLLLGCYRSEYVETSPCLRVLLHAPERGHTSLERRELVVDALTPTEARGLALELLDADDRTAEAAAETIARESRGNPFFVYELVQYIRGGAELTEHSTSSAEHTTLDQVLWSRVTRLPNDARRLLEIVAVAGRPIRHRDAHQAAGLAADERAPLATLRSGHLVRSTGLSGHDEIETYHDKIRETVVDHLPSGSLQSRHRQLALALEASGHADPEALAVHLEASGERERAGGYYAEAAERAATTLAFDRAAKLYRRAMDLKPADATETRRLRVRLADALASAGRGAEAAAEYLTAAKGASAAERLELQRRAAMQSLISGHIDDGLAALQTVLDAAGMKLARTPLRALLSLLLRRAELRLRGLSFHPRDSSQIPAEELTRIDICWSVAVGLSIVDTIRGADFQTRNLLLSLRAGEPYRIARALAWEAAHTTTAGGPAARRTARLLDEAESLAQRIDHPHARGLVTLCKGIAGYMEGRWKDGRTFSDQAEAIFRDQCTGVTWELDTAHSFSNWSIFFLGDVAELIRRLPILRKEALERGDLYAATNLGTFVGYLPWLAADDPAGARRDLSDVIRQWSQRGFHVQHLTGLMATVQIHLYEGNGEAALAHLTEQWPTLRRSMFLRVQTVRTFMRSLRARGALLAAARAADPRPLLRAAERDAARIDAERMNWSQPIAQLIRAGVGTFRGNILEAAERLDTTVAAFDAADMGLFAAAARRRLGELVGGDRGKNLIETANAWLNGQGIQNTKNMTTLHAPGFPS
jgi:serine/threonine protein kinase